MVRIHSQAPFLGRSNECERYGYRMTAYSFKIINDMTKSASAYKWCANTFGPPSSDFDTDSDAIWTCDGMHIRGAGHWQPEESYTFWFKNIDDLNEFKSNWPG